MGLILVFEGLPYLVAPEAMRRWLLHVAEMEPKVLRFMGGLALAGGLFLCFLAQRSGLFG
jgi:uncharacterized protein YjeT (DUF2065 family)